MVHTPKGYMSQKGFVNRLKVYSNLYDKEFSEAQGLESNQCITPVTPFEKRIFYQVEEFDDLLDSSNLTLEDQIKIAKQIESNYNKFDSFIILHGTDTMSYTASSLSFMLENLNKLVILTGSQIPILELKNDAVDNFLGALLLAGQYQIPEVTIFFGNKLIRGNRSTKRSSENIVAFDSPNTGVLGDVGVDFKIYYSRILRHKFEGRLNVFTNLSSDIAVLNMTPMVNANSLKSVMSSAKGVVIQAYGMGNIPSNNQQLLAVLHEAIKRGVILVIKTQCS